VVSCGERLDDRCTAARVETRVEDARLDLGARDRQLVADPLQLPALEHEGRLAAGGLDTRTHLGERFSDPIHRTPPERVVACQLEAPLLPGEEAGEETQGRAGVAAVDWARRLAQAAKANSVDANRVHVFLVDGHAESPDCGDRRLGVGRAPEAADGRLALANGADHHRAVGDRLVAGDGDVADHRRGRLDLHRPARTGETTTP
jgi:hypothetical protein